MSKVLYTLKHSPAACAFCLAFGIGVMLSVAYVDPGDKMAIAIRQAIGGVCLLLPGLAHRLYEEDYE
jgi:CBS-domain-containing membrane protein